MNLETPFDLSTAPAGNSFVRALRSVADAFRETKRMRNEAAARYPFLQF
jgi:hypothetical protein